MASKRYTEGCYVKLSPEDRQRLDAIAEAEEIPVTILCRKALRRWLRNHEEEQARSANSSPA